MKTSFAALIALLLLCPAAAFAQERARADSAWARGETDAAFRLYELVLQKDSLDPVALHRVALVHAWAERHRESLALFDRLLRQQPDNTAAAVDRARVLAWSRRFDEALSALTAVLARVPDEPSALELQAYVYSWSGKYAESLATWNRLFAVSRDTERLRLPRAQALIGAGQAEEGLAELRAVIARDSTNLELLETAADIAASVGQHEYALATYDRLARVSSTPTKYRLRRAQMLVGLQRYDDAMRELDALLAQEPGNAEALMLKALYASWGRRYAESLATYEQLMSLKPADITPVIRYGQVLSWNQQLDSAAAVYRRALELDPQNLDARRGLAQVAMWGGNLPEADRLWRAVLRDHPDDISGLLGLAANLRYQGRHRDAMRTLRRVQELNPNAEGLAEELGYARDALEPMFAPSAHYATDSDGNRIAIAGLTAVLQNLSPIEVRIGGSRKRFEQEGRDLDHDVTSGQVSAVAPIAPGWRVSGSAGIWQSAGRTDQRIGTFSVAASGLLAGRLQTAVSFVRSAFDVTALVVQNAVVSNELTVDAAARLVPGLTAAAAAAATEFKGQTSNKRLLGTGRLSYQWRGVTTGPALRTFTFEKDVNEGYWDPERYTVFEFPLLLASTRGKLQPQLEISPGYQNIKQVGVDDPWSVSLRVMGGVSYNFGGRRALAVQALYANSGLQQLSPVGDSDYQYRGVTVFGSWTF